MTRKERQDRVESFEAELTFWDAYAHAHKWSLRQWEEQAEILWGYYFAQEPSRSLRAGFDGDSGVKTS